jgi:hypothetical protein
VEESLQNDLLRTAKAAGMEGDMSEFIAWLIRESLDRRAGKEQAADTARSTKIPPPQLN